MRRLRFRRIVGVGGIGIGTVWRLEGDRTLGREESRPARRLELADRCKLHIILHYVAVALRDLGQSGMVAPIGVVGADAEGRLLLGEMRRAGMSTVLVRRIGGTRTQTSVCLQYPDGSGGNITECAGAAVAVTPRLVAAATPSLRPSTLVVVAPEVPLATRAALIARARRGGSTVVAAFASQELAGGAADRLLRQVDLLALNMHEARVLAGAAAAASAERVFTAALARFSALNPQGRLSVTDGGRGSYHAAGGVVRHLPGLAVPAANTAGAGDAYFAGLILAETLAGPGGVDAAGACALARAIAAFSVTSPDTIHQGFSLPALRRFARRLRITLPLEGR